MKITSITIIFASLSLLAISRIFYRLKKDNIGIRSAIVWAFLWFCIGFFSLNPSLLNWLMNLAQMQNRMYFILIVAVFILFAVIFNIGSRIDSMERNITRLYQEISILNYKLENKGKNEENNQRH